MRKTPMKEMSTKQTDSGFSRTEQRAIIAIVVIAAAIAT